MADALGLVLARDVPAPLSLPPFTNSAMDGYAVRAADVVAGAVLPVAFDVPAGRTDVPALVAALRAVLKLHKEDGHGWGPGESFCTECQQGYGLLVPYPCPTVTAIRQHLGDDL